MLTQRRKDAKGGEDKESARSSFSSSRLCAFARALCFCLLALRTNLLFACPFCTAVGPSFAERRAESDVVVVAEARGPQSFTLHQVLKGREVLGELNEMKVADDAATWQAGDLAILLGTKSPEWSWDAVPVNETSLAYYARMPDVAKPWDDRLRYAAKFLEHADSHIADDVYRQFGRAPFDAVAAAAEAYDFEQVRRWLVDPQVADERKGFYGLLLGLAKDETERRANVALLRDRITTASSEFRAGFDGILGGLLWAEGVPALDLIDARLLRNPQAPEGDVRHAQTALRFYQQYGHDIPAARLKQSLALLLDRPGTAAGAIQDFTRRQDWEFVERAAKLFADSPGDDPTLDRAVVGYLLVCPQPAATTALKRLREAEPRRVAEAERYLALVGVRGSS